MFWNVRAKPSRATSCGAQVRAVLALEEDAAARRPVEAADDVEHRALAGAVGPDDRRDLAAVDREADVGDRLDAAEVEVDVLDAEDRRGSRGVRRRAAAERLAPLAHLAEREHRLVARVVDVGAEHLALRALRGSSRASLALVPTRTVPSPYLMLVILPRAAKRSQTSRLDDAVGVDDEEVPALAGGLEPAVGLVVERVDLGLGRERHAGEVGLHRADVVVQDDPVLHRSLSHVVSARRRWSRAFAGRAARVRRPRPAGRRPRRRGSAGRR